MGTYKQRLNVLQESWELVDAQIQVYIVLVEEVNRRATSLYCVDLEVHSENISARLNRML